ncbi:unnamed protein product [Mytilus edulis]|uniref:B box-type domain-containing protein n=1 Tax=Mytilus edulis TaxID=6550 RepID=A0A8S3QQQ5_MYTED|nr:unnamed protein product [Mytilus edulis]
MEKDITGGMLRLNCTVLRLTANINFKYPNENFGFAFCKAPSELTAETGPTCDCGCNATSTCRLYRLIKCIYRVQDEPDTAPFTNKQDCHTCRGIAVCAICIDCKHTYCEICCNAHTQYNMTHRVCQIQHVARSQQEIVCDRLKARDPLEGVIFVSAMSKKMVSCVDFKGNKLWTVPVPSPRGLIIVPDCTPGKNMVLCSRRCSAIYGLSKDDGTDEILLAKG